MKIVQINAVYEYSSTGRTTKEMHLSFLERGFQSFVFCTNHQDKENFIFKIGGKVDYNLHALFSRIIGLQGYFSYIPTIKLLKQLGEIHPDVVILRNLHANYIHLPLLLKYLAKYDIPTVVVLHDCWLFTGHCCHYTEDGCYKWQIECNNCAILHKYNKSLFFDFSRKIFRDKQVLFGQIKRLAVIGVSNWVINEAKSSLLGQAKLLQRIYNWVDLEIFKPYHTDEFRKTLGVNEQFVVLGVAQSWSEQKGLSLFISIAQEFKDIKVILIGAISVQQELPDNLISVGIVNDVRHLVQYYSMADVFINPSIQETFGKVSAEALACGTPVIANDATASPELVGDCGYVVHNNNPHEIFAAIAAVREHGKEYYTDKCVSRAQKMFNREVNLEDYIKVCTELMSTPKG